MSRIAKIERKTSETGIIIELNIDGTGVADLDYPIGFMRHMLTTFAVHGLFDISIKAKGDLDVDQHHLVEDTGIVLGQAFLKALGDKCGINRCGSCFFPMDETLARVVCDICGRPHLVYEASLSNIPLVSVNEKNGSSSFQIDTIFDFWNGFTSNANCSLHIDILRGRSDHHKIEAIFKAAARALREACEQDVRALDKIPSAKGILSEPIFIA